MQPINEKLGNKWRWGLALNWRNRLAQGKRRRSVALGWKGQKETVRAKTFFMAKNLISDGIAPALKRVVIVRSFSSLHFLLKTNTENNNESFDKAI